MPLSAIAAEEKTWPQPSGIATLNASVPLERWTAYMVPSFAPAKTSERVTEGDPFISWVGPSNLIDDNGTASAHSQRQQQQQQQQQQQLMLVSQPYEYGLQDQSAGCC